MGDNSLNEFQLERHQIIPNYGDLQMDTSFCLEDDSDVEYILADILEPKRTPLPPKKPLPKAKKLRVRVKRLSREILRRYEKQKTIQRHSPVKHIIRKPQPHQIINNKPALKSLSLMNTSMPLSNPSTVRKFIRHDINQNALISKNFSGRFGKTPAIRHPSTMALNTSNKLTNLSLPPVGNIRMPSNEANAPAYTKLLDNRSSIGMQKATIQTKAEINETKISHLFRSRLNDDHNRSGHKESIGNNTPSFQDRDKTGNNNRNTMDGLKLKTEGRIIVGVKEEIGRKREMTREEYRKKFMDLLSDKKNMIEKSPQIHNPIADRICNRTTVTKPLLNRATESRGTPKLVKEPTIVRVPVAKLVKIPQSATIPNIAKNTEMPKGPANIVKNPEMVKLPNTIKIPDSKLLKMPETTNGSEVVKSSDIVIASKVIISPEIVKVPRAKVIELENNSNAVKVSEMANLTNAVKKPEATKLAATAKPKPKATLNLSPSHQSKCVQTDKEEIPKSKVPVKGHNCQIKAIQTKFTCNDNICGIVDTGQFKLNCFHCYESFTLRNWPAFIRHIKNAHRLEKLETERADRLLTPSYIIPHGTKSKEVQVNTFKGRNILESKIRRSIDEAQESDLMEILVADNTESAEDEQQIEDDIEQVFNALDMEEGDESYDVAESLPSPPEKIAKIIETGVEKGNKISTDIQISNNPSGDIIFVDHSMNKNKMINLPANVKIIKQSNVAPKPQTTFANHTSTNNNTKVIVVNKLIGPTLTVKKDSLNHKSLGHRTVENAPSTTEISLDSLTMNVDFEFIDSAMTESSIKNESLNISQTDVDQDVKIEPAFDVILNDSCDETVLPKNKYEHRGKPKKYGDVRKRTPASQKPKPIPSNLLDSDDEMPSNDDNEDEVPSPTNGCGILFGLTNRKIVLEFIEELQKYPELWKFNHHKDAAVNYHESIRHMCTHINEKFNIDMTEFEVRLSVQRMKYWYCRTLQKMENHKKEHAPNRQAFPGTFPEYFKLLDKFMCSDSNYAKDLVLGRRFQKDDVNEINRYPKWMLYKEPGTASVDKDDKFSLANDLAFSEDAESDQEEEYTASCKPFKSELDTSGAPPEPFICDICFVDFNRPIELTRHRARHFPPQYPCSTCKKMHYSAYLAEKCCNQATEREKSPKGDSTSPLYVCEICGISYKSVGTLNYHKKDKHFNMRNKCIVCKFTSISNYRLVEHQKKRHVVEYGTCEEIAKRTRARTETKVPFNTEARREFEWRREMRKTMKPGELFYGCYRCKQVFETRKEKIQHNREEHPITEATVICLLCTKEKALFSNTNSVRRHYTVVHKVPWDEIDDLVKNTKHLFDLLSPLEIDQLNSSDCPSAFVGKILAKKMKAEQMEKNCGSEISRAIKSISDDFEEELNHTYDPFKIENNADRRQELGNAMLLQDDESNDDDYNQSTLYTDIGLDHDYEDMHEDSFDDDDDYDCHPDSEISQRYEFQCGVGPEHYIIEEEEDSLVGDEFAEIDVGQPGDQPLIFEDIDIENGIISAEIIEEIVEYDFMDDVME